MHNELRYIKSQDASLYVYLKKLIYKETINLCR